MDITKPLDLSDVFARRSQWQGDHAIATRAFLDAVRAGKSEWDAGEIYSQTMQSLHAARRS